MFSKLPFNILCFHEKTKSAIYHLKWRLKREFKMGVEKGEKYFIMLATWNSKRPFDFVEVVNAVPDNSRYKASLIFSYDDRK